MKEKEITGLSDLHQCGNFLYINHKGVATEHSLK